MKTAQDFPTINERPPEGVRADGTKVRVLVVDDSKSIGTVGKAYTKFDAHGNGKIEIDINGRLSIEDAVNNTDEEIPSFAEIKITDYKDNTIYIEKI